MDVADFIVKRMPTIPIIWTSNLYNAMLTVNTEQRYQNVSICLANTESGWFLMIKCDKCNFKATVDRVIAMYDHCRDVERKISTIKNS
jgi:hypothetical protein